MTRSKPLARGLFVIVLLAGLAAGILMPTFAPVRAAPQQAVSPGDVVISEFRFVGSGGASDEFIEIFNRSGGTINLNGWKIKGSNNAGSVGTRFTFTTDVLINPGQHYLISNTAYNDSASNPSLTADFTYSAGFTPDGGVAITLPDDTIIDQVGLSTGSAYKEGTPLTPLSTNVDRGYERNNNGCADTNNNSLDFTLVNPSTPLNSLAAPTYCAGILTFTPAPPTATATPVPLHTIIINEVAWAGTAASSADEWIELFNPGATAININNWRLMSSDGNLDLILSGTIPAGRYFLIARYASVFTDVPIDLPYNSSMGNWSSLNNYGATLRLLDPNGSAVDIANSAGGYWYAGAASPYYASMERFLASSLLNDIPSDWKTFGGTPFAHDRNGNPVNGSPGRSNWALTLYLTPTPTPTLTLTPTVTFTPTVTGTLPTPTRTRRPTEIPPTPFAHVVINEFLPRAGFDWNNDGVIDTNDEFIEIENLGPISVNLNGWKLSDDPNIGGKTFALPSQTLKPGERAVYFGSTTRILLVDSGDTIRLTNPSGVIVDARGYGPVKYPDQSHCRIPDGNGYWQTNCFPTPGNANKLTGVVPSSPPLKLNQSAPCLLPDTTPLEFRLAECSPYGADIWNRNYWDDSAGQKQFIVPDPFGKGQVIVE